MLTDVSANKTFMDIPVCGDDPDSDKTFIDICPGDEILVGCASLP